MTLPKWTTALPEIPRRTVIIASIAAVAVLGFAVLSRPVDPGFPSRLTDKSLDGAKVVWSGTVFGAGKGSFGEPVLVFDHEDGTRLHASFSDSWTDGILKLRPGQHVQVIGRLYIAGDPPDTTMSLHRASVIVIGGK